MRSKNFPVAMIIVFGMLGLVAIIGCFYNPWQAATAATCAIMVFAGIKDLKN